MQVDVSILIPVYNVQDYILRCLESVSSQSYTGTMECLIIDDCGTDGSIDIARRFIAEYNGSVNFRIISHDRNRGLSAARNTAVAHAEGEYIMHLDSDDWLEKCALEELMNKQKEAGADIVSGNALAHYESYTKEMIEPDYADKHDMILSTIKMTMDHVIWRRLIRRRLYTENNIQAEEGVNIGEDHHTLPRLVYYANKIAKVNSIVYHYNCVNPGSYMNLSDKGFNLKRFIDDTRSINLLNSFFSGKDDTVVSHLGIIASSYQAHSLLRTIVVGDKQSYVFLCNLQAIRPHYLRDRLKLRFRQISSASKSILHNLLRCNTTT